MINSSENLGHQPPRDVQRPLFPIRNELDILIDGKYYIDLASKPEAQACLKDFQELDLTSFGYEEVQGVPYAVVPDDFITLGRRLNAAGEDHFTSELVESMGVIQALAASIGMKYGRLPKSRLHIKDFGFLRSNAKAELIPPYEFEDTPVDSGLKVAAFAKRTVQELLMDIATDIHASESQRSSARSLMDKKEAS